jgi:AcrR family transcriptional regulator
MVFPMPRHPDTRARLLEASTRLFAERGVDGVSMRDIATGVGISEGAVYRHFTGKEDLVREIFATHFRALGAEMARCAAGATTLRRQIHAMVHACCALYDANEPVFRLLLLSQHREVARMPWDENHPAIIVRTAIETAIARREIPERDVRLLTAYFFGLLTEPAEIRLYGAVAQPMTALADDIADAIWTVLARKPA